MNSHILLVNWHLPRKHNQKHISVQHFISFPSLLDPDRTFECPRGQKELRLCYQALKWWAYLHWSALHQTLVWLKQQRIYCLSFTAFGRSLINQSLSLETFFSVLTPTQKSFTFRCWELWDFVTQSLMLHPLLIKFFLNYWSLLG